MESTASDMGRDLYCTVILVGIQSGDSGPAIVLWSPFRNVMCSIGDVVRATRKDYTYYNNNTWRFNEPVDSESLLRDIKEELRSKFGFPWQQ